LAFGIWHLALTRIFDEGEGPPILVIPGVQGRWEWMKPALRALARRCRVISYSLGAASTFDALVRQVDEVLDRQGVEAAAICGVSFGGQVAAKYAAARPERTRALILVSTPSPAWTPTKEQARYLARPWLSTPAFLATGPSRMWPEIAAAIDGAPARLRFCTGHIGRMLAAPIVPAQMAARMKLTPGPQLSADCARVVARTLVISGEPGLDRVVPAASTRELVDLIRGARYVMFARTGHVGLVTQPDRFARIAGDFVNGISS
jgi:pimeloyl-ACP methyl ester carboxylesterase